MITMTSATFLVILGMVGSVLAAALALIWRAGVQLGKFDRTLQELSKAVNNLSSLADRVLILETRLGERDRLEER